MVCLDGTTQSTGPMIASLTPPAAHANPATLQGRLLRTGERSNEHLGGLDSQYGNAVFGPNPQTWTMAALISCACAGNCAGWKAGNRSSRRGNHPLRGRAETHFSTPPATRLHGQTARATVALLSVYTNRSPTRAYSIPV